MTIIDLLLAAIVICIVIYVAKLVLDMLELPPPIRQLIMLIIAVVVLFIVLSWFGVVGDISTTKIGSKHP